MNSASESRLPLAGITISQIAPEDTLDIRQIVLWPSLRREELMLKEDADGTHFGASFDGALVAVISLFETPEGIRFRKFATLPQWQGKGVGTQLLQHSIQWARSTGGQRIWCDARVSAAGFYAGLGFARKGDVFEKSGVSYTVMSKAL